MGSKSKKSRAKASKKADYPMPEVPDTKNMDYSSALAYMATLEPSVEDQKLLKELSCRSPLTQKWEHQTKIVAELLKRSGTNVEQNSLDLTGDGDQRPMPQAENSQKRAILRRLWSMGADFNEVMFEKKFSPFAAAVVRGEAKLVEDMLSHTKNGSSERRKLLEYRETGMRLSPLLLLIALGVKNIAQGRNLFFLDDAREKPNYLEVAKTLLSYGARSDARDVAGKTVCHYGAGSMATDLSLQITSLCIEAYKSCAYFEKKIVLKGLSRKELNGTVGTCGGFCNGRRIIYLDDDADSKPVLIKPENIREAGTMKNLTSDELLLNLQDRLGSVSLHETVVCSEDDRGDVVDYLVDHGADVDIVEYDGYSPRRWAETNGQMRNGRKCNLALYRAFRKEEKKVRAKAKCCAYCKKSGSKKHELLRCSRCQVVVYCDATCQRAHWKVHKQRCEHGIKLDRPKISSI